MVGSINNQKMLTRHIIELWHRAGELGNSGSFFNIGCVYQNGSGVKRDEKKATHYWELAACMDKE